MLCTNDSTDRGEESNYNNTDVSNNIMERHVNQLPHLHMLHPCSNGGNHSRQTLNFKTHTAASYTEIEPSAKKSVEDDNNCDKRSDKG